METPFAAIAKSCLGQPHEIGQPQRGRESEEDVDMVEAAIDDVDVRPGGPQDAGDVEPQTFSDRKANVRRPVLGREDDVNENAGQGLRHRCAVSPLQGSPLDRLHSWG